MLSFSTKQMQDLAATASRESALQYSADWIGLAQQVGAGPSISFETALSTVDDLLDRLQQTSIDLEPGAARELAFAVLNQLDRGASEPLLDEAIAAYLAALPSHDAGLILLEFLCDTGLPHPAQPPTELS